MHVHVVASAAVRDGQPSRGVKGLSVLAQLPTTPGHAPYDIVASGCLDINHIQKEAARHLIGLMKGSVSLC